MSIFLLASRYGLNHNSVVSTVKKLGRSDLIDNHRSSGEKELGNSLEKEGVELIKGNRKLIYPLELDIYIAAKKLAIEYCGLYWHCEKNNKDHKYHKNKLDKCKNKDIRLITIFEDEWIYRKNQVLNYLRSVLGLNKNKIYARDCLVKEISKEDAVVFIEANHIQGYGRSVINFGLFYEETLVGVINGSEHHRVNSKSILILNRLCFKEDHQILGGASKLFKYLKIWAIGNNYKQILSWSDNRWSEGNVYLKMGFTLKAHLKPDYSYIYKNDFTKRLPKQSFTKKILFKKGAIGLTEREMAISIGYHRIWDCGKKSWIYNLSPAP